MTPIARPYNNWMAVSRVMATIPAMVAEGTFTPSRALALIIIAGHCNQETGISLASADMLWDEAGIPRRTAFEVIKRLAEDGYLQHVSTYAFKLGDKVQTFTETKPSETKSKSTSTSDTGRKNQLLNYV